MVALAKVCAAVQFSTSDVVGFALRCLSSLTIAPSGDCGADPIMARPSTTDAPIGDLASRPGVNVPKSIALEIESRCPFRYSYATIEVNGRENIWV